MSDIEGEQTWARGEERARALRQIGARDGAARWVFSQRL
jgi:hypothetical protein